MILSALIFYAARVVTLVKSGEVSPKQVFGNVNSAQPKDFSSFFGVDDPKFGKKDAKVVIVEFADFQCPACEEAYPVVKKLLKDYGDRILFVFRNFPLVDNHPQALMAAMAGACANEQGGFWPMYDKIFDNQTKLLTPDLRTYALQTGLNMPLFDTCIAEGKYLKKIEEDLQAGADLGVTATPTFFINGLKLSGAVPFNVFEQMITSYLNQ